MELTTHPKVWKVLGTLAAGLALLLMALMYFKWIFLAMVLGVSLILITERAASKYRAQAARYGLSSRTRWLYGAALVLFWGVAGYSLVSGSLDDLGSAMETLASRDEPIVATYVEKLRPYLPRLLAKERMTDEQISTVQRDGLHLLTRFLGKLPGFIANCVLIIPLMFYVYFGKGGEIAAQIVEAVPGRFRSGFARAAGAAGMHLRSYIEAKLAESAIVGAICAIGFFAAGTKGALALGIFAGLLNMVPYVGPVLGAIPPLWITLAVDEPYAALYVLVTIVIAQLIDNFYLIPFMVSDRIKVNPLLNIILVLAGARVYGAVGMLFAIPIYLVFKTVLADSYRELVRLHDPKRATSR